MKKNLLQALKIVFFFSLGAGILLYVYFNFNTKYCDNEKIAYDSYALLNKIVADFGRLNWWWMGALLLAYLMSNLSRALRWNLLIEPLGVKARTVNTFFATIIGYLVNLAFPRAGEIAKPAVVARYEKLPLDRLIGTIVVDRIVDLSIFACLIGLSFLMEFDRINTFIQAGKAASSSTPADGAQQAASGPPWILIGLGVAFVLGLIYVFVIRKLTINLILLKIRALMLGFWEGIKTVAKVKRRGAFIFHSLNIWLMYYLMVYFCFFAFPPLAPLNVSMMPALLVFVASTLAMLFPSPGGMGAFHWTTTIALVSLYGIKEEDAFSFANIIFFFIQSCNIVIGIVGYIILPRYNKRSEVVPA